MSRSVSILCAAKLHKNQLERHLELFEFIPEVSEVLVVRREPLGSRLDKLHDRGFQAGSLGVELLRMGHQVRSLCRHHAVDWVIGFNPVPWGSVALAAAKSSGVRSCLSLIGMDFLQIQRLWGWPFLQAVRSADAVTVTGERMKTRLVELGVFPERLHVLPHSVDVARFSVTGEPKRWDVVATGQLIRRKRLDVLIDAVAILRERGQLVRVGILGRGPLEAELKERAKQKHVDDLVEFLGFRNDVERVLQQAQVFCLPSAWEGVPFALMEAMACGLVPVMTRVGTIEDWVRPGENGLLVEVGDAPGLAEALCRALSPSGEQLREQVLAEREGLSFSHGAAVWRTILELG